MTQWIVATVVLALVATASTFSQAPASVTVVLLTIPFALCVVLDNEDEVSTKPPQPLPEDAPNPAKSERNEWRKKEWY